MPRPVRPSLFFWYLSSFGFSYLAVMSTYNMDIFKNRSEEIMIGVVLNLILYFSWYFGFLAVTLLFGYLLRNPNADRLFHGHERLGKAIGAALMLFGNILVYYFSEKSVACMFAYLFLVCTFLCGLCYIQPFTDFGVVDFLLSASLNVALSRFGIRVGYTWLVLGACVSVAGMRYWLDPMEAPAETVEEAEMALQGGSDQGTYTNLKRLRHKQRKTEEKSVKLVASASLNLKESKSPCVVGVGVSPNLNIKVEI